MKPIFSTMAISSRLHEIAKQTQALVAGARLELIAFWRWAERQRRWMRDI